MTATPAPGERWVLVLVSAILGCWPVGLVAIALNFAAGRRHQRGDTPGAVRMEQWARALAWLSIASAFVLVAIVVVVLMRAPGLVVG